MVHREMEQDAIVLAPPCPLPALLSVENFSQRKCTQRKENMQKQRKTAPRRPNNNNVVIKYSQGPLVPSQGP